MMTRIGQKKTRSGSFTQRPSQDSKIVPVKTTGKQGLLLLGAFLVLMVALTRAPQRNVIGAETIDTSVVAWEEIKAAFYFESVDLKATEEAQSAAMGKVPDYYRVDQDRVRAQLKSLRARVDRVDGCREAVQNAVFEALKASTSAPSEDEVISKAVHGYVARLKEDPEWADMPDAEALALWLSPDPGSVPKRQFAPPPEEPAPEGAGTEPEPRPVEKLVPEEPGPFTFSIGERLRRLAREGLEYVLTQGVRKAATQAGGLSEPVVILRDTPLADQQVSTERPLSTVADPAQATEALGARLRDKAKEAAKEVEDFDEWARLHEAALAMATPEIVDTIRYDKVYTAGARERARESVEPATKGIEAGEIIQDRGKRWTPQSRFDVKTYLSKLQNEEKPAQRWVGTAVAHMILVALALSCLYKSVGLLGSGSPEDFGRNLNLALLVMCATVAIGRTTFYFEQSGYVLPVAAAGILFAILVNVRLAALVSLLTVALVSIQYAYDWRLLIVGSAMSLAGVFSVFEVRRRSDMAAASLKAVVVGLLAMVAIILATDSLLSETALRRLMLIGFNGVVCLLVVPGLLSPLERLFGITTDIQLLEYSDLNNKVLGQLAVEAPATYAHGLMLGQLAEAAAEAIGANGLMARVCAYYHDIGKMRRSEYFSENQRGYNIHDDLSPRLSARAIAAHVIQGAEMAREYHLPKPIVDAILEHHGTCRIGYFYQQALEQQKHGDVREEDFRYPGPKPQSPETAILMICDAVESGVRSIKTPNAERVREFVDKIIAARSADRQFDDCNLTLKQLDTIAEVLARRVMSSLHTRIAYPETKEQQQANVIPMSGSSE